MPGISWAKRKRGKALTTSPHTAKNRGARLVAINPETTDLTRRLTAYYFDRSTSQFQRNLVSFSPSSLFPCFIGPVP